MKTCPGCSGPATPFQGKLGPVVTCGRCGGLFTVEPIDNLASYTLIHGDWCRCGKAGDARARYFDLDVEGRGEMNSRRHGWFDPVCRGITQTG